MLKSPGVIFPVQYQQYGNPTFVASTVKGSLSLDVLFGVGLCLKIISCLFFFTTCIARDMIQGPHGGSRIVPHPRCNARRGLHGGLGGDRPPQGEIRRRSQKGTFLEETPSKRYNTRILLLPCIRDLDRVHASNGTWNVGNTSIIRSVSSNRQCCQWVQTFQKDGHVCDRLVEGKIQFSKKGNTHQFGRTPCKVLSVAVNSGVAWSCWPRDFVHTVVGGTIACLHLGSLYVCCSVKWPVKYCRLLAVEPLLAPQGNRKLHIFLSVYLKVVLR